MGDSKKSDTKKQKKAAKAEEKRARRADPRAANTSPEALIAAARAAAFTDPTPKDAFDHFRPIAEKVPTADLAIFTSQPLILRTNILRALEAVEPHLAAAVSALREPKLQEIFELPSLVMALDFAAARVPVAKLSAGEIDKMLSEGSPWRELMLSYLEVVAHPLIGLVPRERVAAIRAGSGKLDKARDFVALPGLFAEFEKALEGKHPFPADKLDLLATLGGTLVQQVRPGNAVVQVAKRSGEAILRDQFAELVAERYDRLQVLAGIAVGRRKADELLPSLRSTVALGGASSSAEAAETPATPAPAAPTG